MDIFTQEWVTDQARWPGKDATYKPRPESPRIASPALQQASCADDRCCSTAAAQHSNTPVCTDPACSEIDFDCDECFDFEKYCRDCSVGQQAVCEECSDHDPVCTECFDDCTSECDLPADPCGEKCGVQCDFSAARPCTESCEDQATEATALCADSSAIASDHHQHWATSHFGHHLTAAYLPPEHHSSHFPGFSRGGASSNPYCTRQPTGFELLQAAGSVCLNEARDQHLYHTDFFEDGRVFKMGRAPHEINAKSFEKPLSCTSGQLGSNSILKPPSSSVRGDTRVSYPSPQKSAFQKSRSHDIVCQWADHDDQPCGKLFHQADDLHEHLREVHNTKSDVFCRWIGCPLSVHTANPHRYANSVQRHTWGHSGYRPYKCSACGEGFAAANVRDEHFSNIHLKVKQFRCDICSHQCTSATNLKRHKDERHRAERFQCEFCNRSGKIKLFPRGPNLARHFRKCKFVLATFPEANGAAEGKIDDSWYPPGYNKGHHGMNRAKITPPDYLQS